MCVTWPPLARRYLEKWRGRWVRLVLDEPCYSIHHPACMSKGADGRKQLHCSKTINYSGDSVVAKVSCVLVWISFEVDSNKDLRLAILFGYPRTHWCQSRELRWRRKAINWGGHCHGQLGSLPLGNSGGWSRTGLRAFPSLKEGDSWGCLSSNFFHAWCAGGLHSPAIPAFSPGERSPYVERHRWML